MDEKPSSDIYWEYTNGLENFLKLHSYPPITWISLNKSQEDKSFEDRILSVANLGCQGYIVATPRVKDFITLKYNVTQKSILHRRNDYFIFLLDDQDGSLTQEILHHSAMKLYPSHLIVRNSKNGTFDLITQKFVSNFNNEEGMLLDILQKDGSLKENAAIFPDKLNNLQGRDIPMGTHTYLPYSVIQKAPYNGNKGNVDELGEDQPKTLFIDGTEAIMVIEFSRLKNFTMKFKMFGIEEFGSIYANGTGEGILGNIYLKNIDFGFGCTSLWYYELLDYSHVNAASTVVLIIPAAKMLPPAIAPLLPFTWKVWLGITLTILIDILVYYWLGWHSLKESGKESSWSSAMLIVGGIYLQQCIPDTKKDSSVRGLVAILLVSSLVLGNSYGGALSSVLTVPSYEDSVDTVRKIVDKGYKWGGPSLAWVNTIMRAEDPDYQALIKNFEVHPVEKLRELSFRHDYGLAFEKTTSGRYAFGPHIKLDVLDHFELFKKFLFFEWSTPNAVRGWPLMEYFNKHLLEVLQHGLFDFWERRSTAKYFDVTTELVLQHIASGHHMNPGVIELQVSHISGALFVLAMGLLIAFLVFLVELLAFHYHKRH
ncbi:uncharacterized protein LOC132257966 [Phlebotomus argentipes]|uniref:uncharacterized protein LOC132257966 n=1 Tax=Phlebotomus argentipes TaxID=94469 RepID=UPI00289302AE|nr:uncharacterized protein LOC132257966 [Phlebotomus argentipes]